MYYSGRSLDDLNQQEPMTCSEEKFPCPEPVIYVNYFSLPILLMNLVALLNFIVQLLAIRMVYTTKKMQKSSFFVLLITLAISVILRITISFITTIIAALFPTESLIYSIAVQLSLNVDYCSNYFSIILIFTMSLNRCLVFVRKSWSEHVFEGKKVLIPVILSLLIAIFCGVWTIISNEIQRKYYEQMGFVDVGNSTGYRKLVNRYFFVFPVGSIVCYLVLYHYFWKRNKSVSTRHEGEQKVFYQLLFTGVFYGTMSVILEVINTADTRSLNQDTLIELISIFNILNYLPEVSLPFLLVVKSFKRKKRISTLNRSQSQTAISVRPSGR